MDSNSAYCCLCWEPRVKGEVLPSRDLVTDCEASMSGGCSSWHLHFPVKMMARYWGPYLLCKKPQWSSWLSDLAWPNVGHCNHLGREGTDGESSPSSLSLSLCIQISIMHL